jgi:hypothetical protein
MSYEEEGKNCTSIVPARVGSVAPPKLPRVIPRHSIIGHSMFLTNLFDVGKLEENFQAIPHCVIRTLWPKETFSDCGLSYH